MARNIVITWQNNFNKTENVLQAIKLLSYKRMGENPTI